MDAADLKTIHDFTDVPFTVEASASAADYAARASSMLAGSRLRIDTDGLGNVPYRKALNDIRKQIDTAFAKDDSKRIEFFNLAETHPVKEAIRIDLALAKSAAEISARAKRDGAFTVETSDSFEKPLCVVVGPQPSMNAREYFAGKSSVSVNTAGLDDETMQRFAMWHEAGHCLLGSSDAAADVFAVLMEFRHSNAPGKLVPLLASFREFEEMTSPTITDDRLVSSTLWSLNKIEAKIRKSKTFKAMGLKEVASLASEIVAEFAPAKEQRAHVARFRAAVNGIVSMKVHFAPVADGVKPISAEQWIEARSKAIPEFARLRTVVANLKGGMTILEPQGYDAASFASAISGLARSGDPTADSAFDAYKDPARLRTVASASFDDRIGLRRVATNLGNTIKFDRSSERMSVSPDNDVWEIRNAETGDFVKSGSVSLGSEWAQAEYPKFLPPAQVAFGN